MRPLATSIVATCLVLVQSAADTPNFGWRPVLRVAKITRRRRWPVGVGCVARILHSLGGIRGARHRRRV